MIVLLAPGHGQVGVRVRLLEGEGHHLRVRRARDGDVVELRDGQGLVGRGRLVQTGREWEVEVTEVSRRPAPPPLLLGVGAGDRDRFAWVVEKAVELGVTAVAPVETERTAGVAGRVRPASLEKLRRQALEAVKQSGNAWSCTVEEPAALAAFLARPGDGERWLADRAGHPPPAMLPDSPCTVLIGPEGGLTATERAAALGAGFAPVALGPHILRLETAAVAAAAAVQVARLRRTHG